MKSFFTLFFLSILVFLIFPENSFCWGIGTHLFIGNTVLDFIKLLGINSLEFLIKFKDPFLYGTISADILIGKGKKLYPTHCHSWNVGFSILNMVKSPPLKAYAYGYLVHLSSDVIAHNFFVPNLLQLSKGKGKVAHILIEASADKELNFSKESLLKLVKSPFKDGDDLLQKVLFKSKLNFLFKKSLYKVLNLVSLKKRRLKTKKEKRASIILKNGLKDYLYEMVNLSVSVSLDCLKNLTSSFITSYDPMGFENLKLVKRIKKRFTMNPLYQKNIYFFFTPSLFMLNRGSLYAGKNKKS